MCIGGGIALAVGLLWNLVMPINKSLWTSSFVIYTADYFAFVLALFIWLVDIRGHHTLAKPLVVYGSNPLFIYVVSIFWVKIYYLFPLGASGNLYQSFFVMLNQWMDARNASLLFAIIHVILFWFISVLLFKRNVFIKV